LPRFRGGAWFGTALGTADACGRHTANAKTLQNEEELARLCRTAVMAIEREDEPGARWARMRLESWNGMFISTLFLMR
jgi:hypothetical protein